MIPLKNNPEQHEKCPQHFTFGECQCTCGHSGERSVEDREGTFEPKEKKTRRKSAAKPK